LKVLIVDDGPVNRKLLRALLEIEGIAVIEAENGVEALETLGGQNLDAIISDILMPSMDGYRLCKEVRASEKWHDLPFIFYSATYTEAGDEKLCYDLGGDRYLRKPSSGKMILAALREVTQRNGTHPQSHAVLSEPEVTRKYNERLVRKLEEKNEDLALRTAQLEQAQARLEEINRDLDQRVRQRTAELEMANQELEAFSYSVSHDLRSPLNHIGGYIDMLVNNCAGKLDEESLKHLHVVRNAARRMGDLIHALMELSRVGRATLECRAVDLSAMANEILAELKRAEPARQVETCIAPGLVARADQHLMHAVLVNLLGNAWKYSSKRADACIEFGRLENASPDTFFVRDNGAGFDMKYIDRLFRPFQRLHTAYEFEGNGIGLATVRRVLSRHNGCIWAESKEGQGASFYFTLGPDGADQEFAGNSS
jgi:signal transduction histidine kinase